MPAGERYANRENRAQLEFGLACYNICAYMRRMVLELKLRKVGNSVGVVLPKETLARLNVEEGDTLALTDTPEGGLRVTPPGYEGIRAEHKRTTRRAHATPVLIFAGQPGCARLSAQQLLARLA